MRKPLAERIFTSVSGTFVCPHCNATYPRKPVLVGRVVRCTTCKNAFRLREDGVAEAVVPPASGEPATSTTLARTDADGPAEPQGAEALRMIPAPEPAASLDLTPSGGHPAIKPITAPQVAPTGPVGGRSVRLTAQQMQARRAMAATLTTSISAALESDAARKEEAGERRRSRTEQISKVPGKEGAVGSLGPAILTGSGEEESRSLRTWMIGCLGLLATVLLGGWLLFSRSPERQALEDFTLVQSAHQKEYGDRMSALQANAWFITLPPHGLGVTPLQDLGTPHLGRARAFNVQGLRSVATELLKGLEPAADGYGWSTPAASPDRPGAPAAGRIVTPHDLDAALAKLGYDPEDQEIVAILLLGHTRRDGSNEIARRLRSGDLPEAMEILPFTGRDGMALLRGQNRARRFSYKGTLLRFSGSGWPSGWRVLTLTTVNDAER